MRLYSNENNFMYFLIQFHAIRSRLKSAHWAFELAILPFFSQLIWSCAGEKLQQVGIMLLHVSAGHAGGAAGAVRRLPLEVGEIRADRWHQQARHSCLWEEKGFQGDCQPRTLPLCVCVDLWSTCVSVCACRGCQNSTTTSIAPTSRWPRWWTQRSGSLVATTEWLSMDRWGDTLPWALCAYIRSHNSPATLTLPQF